MSISYTVVVQDELNAVKRLHHTIGVCKKPQDESIAVHLYREEYEMNDPIHVEIKEYLMDNFDTYSLSPVSLLFQCQIKAFS